MVLRKIKTAVFISGKGSNLKNLIKFSLSKNSPIDICLVISSNPKAKGLNFAKKYSIEKKVFSLSKKKSGENKIIKILDTKIRPAVARDGGDITFVEFKDGKVKVMLKGSCSGCPSSTLTLKQAVQNLLCHYIPEVKEVLAV